MNMPEIPTDIKSVRVIGFYLCELLIWAAARKLDVSVGGVKLLGKIHLQAPRSSDGDLAAAILTEQLGEHLQNIFSAR